MLGVPGARFYTAASTRALRRGTGSRGASGAAISRGGTGDDQMRKAESLPALARAVQHMGDDASAPDASAMVVVGNPDPYLKSVRSGQRKKDGRGDRDVQAHHSQELAARRSPARSPSPLLVSSASLPSRRRQNGASVGRGSFGDSQGGRRSHAESRETGEGPWSLSGPAVELPYLPHSQFEATSLLPAHVKGEMPAGQPVLILALSTSPAQSRLNSSPLSLQGSSMRTSTEASHRDGKPEERRRLPPLASPSLPRPQTTGSPPSGPVFVRFDHTPVIKARRDDWLSLTVTPAAGMCRSSSGFPY